MAAPAINITTSLDAKGLRQAQKELDAFKNQVGAASKSVGDKFNAIGVADLSQELGVAQSVLTGGLYQALSAGVPRDNVFDFMRIATKAGIAGVTDTETAVDGLTTVINAFGLDMSQAQAVSDSLFTAVKGGKTTFSEMSDSLFNVAPAAAAAGVSFQEVNAALAAMTSSGVPTSVATTQVRAALTGLQKPSKELDAIFQKLGYQNAQVALESQGLAFALDAVKTASNGNNGELQRLLGSTEAVAAANILAGTGAEKFTAEMEAQATAIGATDAAFSEIDKSRSLERLKISIQNIAVQVGNILIPAVERVIAVITPWIERFRELDPNAQRLVVTIAGVAAAIGPLLIVGGKLIASVKLIIGVVKGLGIALQFLAANPVGLIILAIAALVAGVIYAYNNFEWFRNGVQAVWQAIQTAITWAWENVIKPIWNLIGWYIENILVPYFKMAQKVWSAVFNAIAAVITWVWDSIIKPVWDAIKWYIENVLVPYFEMALKVWSTVWDGITGAVRSAWSFISGIFDSIKNAIGTVASTIGGKIDEIIGFFTGLKDKITRAVSGVWDGLTDAFKGTLNGIIGMWNDLKIPSFTFGGWNTPFGKTPSFTTPEINFPDLPTFAKGGVVPGIPGAPVLAIVHGGETISRRTEQPMGSQGGDTNVNVNVYGSDADPYEIARELLWSLKVAG
jgi:TP901 family phage tail tape measure protein